MCRITKTRSVSVSVPGCQCQVAQRSQCQSQCQVPVHTQPSHGNASREPLQFGAELYGHQGQEADLEILELVLTILNRAGVGTFVLDLADVRVVDALLAPAGLDAGSASAIHQALAKKDTATLIALTEDLPEPFLHLLQNQKILSNCLP